MPAAWWCQTMQLQREVVGVLQELAPTLSLHGQSGGSPVERHLRVRLHLGKVVEAAVVEVVVVPKGPGPDNHAVAMAS